MVQIHWSRTGAEGIFPTIFNDFVSDTMVVLGLWEFFPPLCLTQSHYKWWENSHKPSSASVNLDQNPDPEAGKSINILPPAPLLSCSLSVKEVGTKSGTRLVHKLIQRLVPTFVLFVTKGVPTLYQLYLQK